MGLSYLEISGLPGTIFEKINKIDEFLTTLTEKKKRGFKEIKIKDERGVLKLISQKCKES